MSDQPASSAVHQARRVVIAVVGFTVLALGVAMLILPGPGLAVVIGGLAILASEFVWARRLLKRVREQAQSAGRRVRGAFGGDAASPTAPAEPPSPTPAQPPPAPGSTSESDARTS